MNQETTSQNPPTTAETENREKTVINMNAAFMDHLTGWHESKVALLQHMLDIPDGTELILDDTKTLILTDNTLEGFKTGVSICLMELGVLPFSSMVESTKIGE